MQVQHFKLNFFTNLVKLHEISIQSGADLGRGHFRKFLVQVPITFISVTKQN